MKAGMMPDSHELILENVTLEDTGWYKCVAINSIGRSEKKIYVDVMEDVPVIYSEDLAYSSLWIIITFIGVFIFFILVVGVLCCFLRKLAQRHKKDKLRMHSGYIKRVTVEKRPLPDSDDGALIVPEVSIKNGTNVSKTGQEYELPIDPVWEFPREKLQLGMHLGEGAFGEVKLGTADGIVEKGIISTVAVKALKSK